MVKRLKTLLTIAATDPVGGAGIQADIRVGSLLGFHVATAVTAVTVQNSNGLTDIGQIPANLLEKQLIAISQDVIPDAIKIGMIGTVENFEVISDFLQNIPKDIPVVVDPVFTASANNKLLLANTSEGKMANLYLKYIFPYATVITPNLNETGILSEEDNPDYKDFQKIREKLNVKNLIITNGDADIVTDYLISEGKIISHTHPKIKSMNLHGTGCVYSSLLACFLALGKSVEEVFNSVNIKMEEIINKSNTYKLDKSSYGPLNINDYLL